MMFGSFTNQGEKQHHCGSANSMTADEIKIWNAAIEAAAKNWVDSAKYYGYDIQKEIRKLKK